MTLARVIEPATSDLAGVSADASAAPRSDSPQQTETDADAEGVIIVRYYFYKGFPFVILGAVVLLAVPYLGLLIFGMLALVALAGLAWAIAFVPYTLGRSINRRWQYAHSASPPTAPVLSPAEHQNPWRAP